MSTKTRVNVTSQQALNQALVAFGSGVQGMYVKSDAIEVELIEWFKDPFGKAVTPASWKLSKLFILECARTIGRLAAQKAISAGRIAISKKDVSEARKKVVDRYQGEEPGAYCKKG